MSGQGNEGARGKKKTPVVAAATGVSRSEPTPPAIETMAQLNAEEKRLAMLGVEPYVSAPGA